VGAPICEPDAQTAIPLDEACAYCGEGPRDRGLILDFLVDGEVRRRSVHLECFLFQIFTPEGSVRH
jgi:hypothetical protein